jgi:hypothetical protein
MTAFAFILGVVPLMLANGAGAGAQNVMGTGVFWGMLVATALGVFIIPGNFAFIEGIRFPWQAKPDALVPATNAGGGTPTVDVHKDHEQPSTQPALRAQNGDGDGSVSGVAPAKAGGSHG